jgi:hypothetical protein
MPKLFWLVYGERPDMTLFIRPAETMVYAQLKASIAGMNGEYKEGYDAEYQVLSSMLRCMSLLLACAD